MKRGMFRGLCLSLSLLSSLTALWAGDLPENLPDSDIISASEQTGEQEYYDLLHTMLDTALDHTQTIISSLDDLVLYLNRGSIKPTNPNVTREMIISLKRIIREISDPKYFNPVSEYGVYTLLQINSTLISHINQAIDNGLNEFPQLNAEDFALRNHYELSLAKLREKLFENNQKITQLKNKVQNVGLSCINKSYRWLEDYNNRFNLLPRAFKLGCAGCIGLLALYMLPRHTFDKWELSPDNPLARLKDFLGEKAPFTTIGDEVIVDPYEGDAPGVLRACENLLARAGIKYGGIGITIVLGDILKEPVKTAMKNTYETVSNYLLNLHHKLRGSNIKIVKKDDKQVIDYSQVNADFIGMEWAKEEIENAIRYICDPDRYERYGIPIPKGFLFTGPPGTGKTEFARWICAEINHRLEESGKPAKTHFKSVAWYELISGNGIKDVIKEARENAPCIIFIDEIDTIGLQRDRASQLLNEILQELSGLNNLHNGKIIFIGATNKPEHLDPAMRRSGRLGKEILFPLPDLEKRRAYFEHQRKQYAIDSAYFDSISLAKQTTRCSFADLKEITGTAALLAKREERSLSQYHFQHSIDRFRGLTNAKNITPQQRVILSVYLAGQVASHLILKAHEVMCATILPYTKKIKEQNVWNKQALEQVDKQRLRYGKLFVFNEQETLSLTNEDELKKEIQLLLAGHIAEEVLLGAPYYSHHPKDKNKALEIALKIRARGLALDKLPKKMREQYILDAQAMVEECEQSIREKLGQYKQFLIDLERALEQKSTLYQKDIQELFQGYAID